MKQGMKKVLKALPMHLLKWILKLLGNTILLLLKHWLI